MMIIASFMNHHNFLLYSYGRVYRFYDSLCLAFLRPLVRALLDE